MNIQGLKMNPFSLRFMGEFSSLENEFKQNYAIASINQLIFANLLSLFFVAIFAPFDAFIVPDYIDIVYLIRYGFICPIIIIFLPFITLKKTAQYFQQCVTLQVVLCGVGFTLIAASLPIKFGMIYSVSLAFLFLFNFTLYRQRFIWAMAAAIITVTIFNTTMILSGSGSVKLIIFINFYFSGTNIVGMFVCYTLEKSERTDFILKHLLEMESDKAIAANRDLELRVNDRTYELSCKNKELIDEINKSKMLQEKLIRAERMEAIGLVASGVAHDLNNILAGVVGYPDLVIMDLPPDSPFIRPLMIMKDSGERAAAIVQDLLSLARKGAISKAAIQLNGLIEDYLKSPEHRKLLEIYPGFEVKTEFSENLFPISGSAPHLSNALMNLVFNAAESIEKGGTILICTENKYIEKPFASYNNVEAGIYSSLSVIDTGSGIDEKNLEKIFEPFYSKKKPGRSGTGLGLTVVWGTVHDHDGYIDVQSQIGEGTTFTLYFPSSKEALIEGKAASLPGAGETVLVVDDLEDQRIIACAMLEKLGYNPKAVSSGEEAIGYLRSSSADIVILDMIMEPGMGGLQTYQKIQEINPGQKAIVASGFSETGLVEKALQLGAGAFLKKPFTVKDLGNAVRKELDRS